MFESQFRRGDQHRRHPLQFLTRSARSLHPWDSCEHAPMRWLAKAAVQGVISELPRSHEINYIFQRKVSRRLPRIGEEFDFHADTAAQHVRSLQRHRPQARLGDLQLYEFGSGWDLIGAIALWALGAERQLLIDIRRDLRIELVNHTLAQFARRHDELQARLGGPLRR